jgi:hypothetical protein
VWFVIADYFAVSDLSIFWDASEFHEETCVGGRDVPNTLEWVSVFVAKASLPKWLEMGNLHEFHVFHFFPGDGVNDCVGLVLLRPMVVSKGDGHVDGVHSTEVVLG